jgi:hypothetical protein
MEIDLENASTLYVFKPPAGYRTTAQLVKKLNELKKKDQQTEPQISFAGSVPQVRDFAEYIQSEWWQKREFQNFEFQHLLEEKIHIQYFRNWAKLIFDPSVELRFKESIYRAALEVELAALPEA